MVSISSIGAFKSNDLLMDVIRAADPARERRAIERLQGKTESDNFVKALNRSSLISRVTAPSVHSPPTHRIENPKSIGEAFESAMLSSLIENVFSTKSDSAFGSGVAGSSFKSLFSEQVANQIVRHGGLGIAEIIENYKNSRTASKT
ncbi:MAG: rod-binding protein [Beijerinckiaceae bacterium]|nr:rod-binding protein [Beijerinckiaceae bacterium]